MPLTGVDCSRHQGTVDWAKVRAAGHGFAFIKATDGVTYRYVNWFHANAPKVRAAGLTLGAYHFLLDHHPGAAQARYYIAEVNKAGGFAGVVPIVDIEREADGTTPRAEHLRDFVFEFRRLVPGRPILIYTGKWYWVGVLGNPYGGNNLGPLWHSEYDGISPIDENVANGPELDAYGGWDECLVWQHTSSGTCPGVSTRCDLNIFYGDHAQLAALAGAGAPATPVPEPKEDDMRIIDEKTSPALLVRGDGTYRALNTTERGAWRAAGVEAHLVTKAQRDIITAAAPKPLDVEALAEAFVAELPAGSVDVAAFTSAATAAFRTVLSTTAGRFELAD